MDSQQHSQSTEKEMSLKELILIIKEYFFELVRYWKLIAICTTPFIGYFLYKAFTTPKTYKAKLTFMVNEDEGAGAIGGAMAILSQFGVGNNTSGYNKAKMLDLSKSRRIIQKVLFDSLEIKDENDFIANHLIHLYQLHDKWEDSEAGLKDFVFDHGDTERFNRIENAAFLAMHRIIVGGEKTKGLYTNASNEETGIMTLAAETRAEVLSIELLNKLYDELGTYYIEKAIEKQKSTYEVVEEKVDSIKRELNGKEYALANFKDRNRGLYSYKDQIKEQRLMVELQVLGTMYGEAVKNLEIADFTLKNKTPFIQLIDAPIGPLKPLKQSKLTAIILGGILGGLLGVIFVIARKIWREALQDDSSA